MKTTIVAFLIALATLCGMAPANAVLDDATKTVQVRYPLASQRIQIEGSHGTGIRKIAREIDRKLDSVTIFRKGKCADRPQAVCVRVVHGYYDKVKAPWYAAVHFPRHNLRVIKVNLNHPHHNDYAVIAHEFGHIMGLHHHAQDGVVGGTPDVVHFSNEEVRALRRAYSN